MAKTMAHVENGVVTNLLWCSDSARDSDEFVSVEDRPAAIGDEYRGGSFFREGKKVLTPSESDLAEMDAALLDAEYENILGGL